MKLIEQKAELLIQPECLEGMYKQIEIASRTCYKSENNSTGDSKSFVDKLIKMKHFSMLEQGTVYLHLKKSNMELPNKVHNLAIKYRNNPYSRIKIDLTSDNAYITTNYRVIKEHGWEKDLQYLCKPTEHHVKRYTFRLITSIGIVRELLRHRVFSFANESTRYCNYSKDRFNKEITFINNSDKQAFSHTYLLMEAMGNAEKSYFKMIEKGLSPQQAREVLPLCTKSELIMTGFEDDWERFLDVRLKGTTGKPHPDMIILAQMIQDELDKIQN